MADKDGYRRYLDAAAVLRQITRARAEGLVRDMMGGDAPRTQTSRVDELVERGKRVTEDLVDLVRSEVSSQLDALGLDADDLARQAADILRRSAEAGRVVIDAKRARRGAERTHEPGGGSGEEPARTAHARERAEPAGGEIVRTAPRTATKATAKKTAAKKTTTKKTAAKKATAKKTAAKSPAAKKTAAKSPAAKKTAAKKTTAKKTAAKKTAGKKAATKKTPAKKRAGDASSTSPRASRS